MNTVQTIHELVNRAKSSPKSFEPSKFLQECRKCLYKDFVDPGDVDAFKGWHSIHDDYCVASEILYRNNFFWAAEQLLFLGWNYLGNRQLKEKKKVYRAPFSYQLTKLYILSGDKGAALRWSLLTHADDMLGEHEHGGGAGKEWLLTTLGMSEEELWKFDEIAAENVKEIRNTLADDWSKPAGFAEDVLVQLMQKGPQFAHLFSRDTHIYEFPLSVPYLKSLLGCFDALNESPVEKGSSLERLASYIFSLIPGWVARRNVLHEDLSFETDLVVSNLNSGSNLATELLGRHFLVECKNWDKPVGVREVGYFLYRMRLTHAKFGVILVQKRITGKENEVEEKAARSLIRKAFHEDGNICIDLNKEDLSNLLKGNSFWGMLLERIEKIRFGNPKVGKSKD